MPLHGGGGAEATRFQAELAANYVRSPGNASPSTPSTPKCRPRPRVEGSSTKRPRFKVLNCGANEMTKHGSEQLCGETVHIGFGTGKPEL